MIKNVLKNLLMVVLIMSMSLVSGAGTPLAHANSFDDVCGPIYQRKADHDANPTAYNVPVGVEQCDSAKSAKLAETVAITKTAIFAAAAIMFGIMMGWEWAGTGAACKWGAIGIGAAATLTDMITSAKIDAAAKNTMSSISPIAEGLVASGVAQGGVKELIKDFFGKTAKVVTKETAHECGSSMAVMIALAALGGLEIAAAIRTKNKLLDSASEALATAGAGPRIQNQNAPGAAPINAPVDASVSSGSSSGNCQNASGNDYLACLNQEAHDPVLSAIIADNKFTALMGKALQKPLGDFAKGYKGDGSLHSIADYAGAAMGLSDGGLKNFKSMLDKSSEFLGGSQGAAYASQNSKSEGKTDDIDFNKLMSGLLKQMNPDEKVSSKEDPSEKVFRKLDLLSSDKIESSKDISLFVRVGYRYRKKSDTFSGSQPGLEAKGTVKH